jgi:hypothetical protein
MGGEGFAGGDSGAEIMVAQGQTPLAGSLPSGPLASTESDPLHSPGTRGMRRIGDTWNSTLYSPASKPVGGPTWPLQEKSTCEF